MQWTSRMKIKVKPYMGEIRTVSWFAFFPVTIGRKTKWLEKVTIKQKCNRTFYRDEYNKLKAISEWLNIEFVN